MYTMWIDCETGGVNPARNPLLQLAGFIEDQGRILHEFNWKMQPKDDDLIEQKALEVTGFTIEEIMTWQHSLIVYNEFLAVCDTYVNKYDKKDKMVLAGYNAQFDKNFIYHWFKKHGNKFFFSYFYGMPMDIGSFVLDYCISHDIKLTNHKLSTVAEHFGFNADFHDAMEDITVTRAIYTKLKEATSCA